MVKRVTAFCGSPRTAGNTETLLRIMLDGAKSKGASIQFRKINTMSIRGCQACEWCNDKSAEFCIQQDDMQTLYQDIRDSDAVIFGTPIYMWQMTGQMKVMLDRLYGLILQNFDSKIGPRKTAMLFTQAASEGSFQAYIDSTVDVFRFLKFDVQNTLVAADTEDPEKIKENKDLMEKAFSIGLSLVDFGNSDDV